MRQESLSVSVSEPRQHTFKTTSKYKDNTLGCEVMALCFSPHPSTFQSKKYKSDQFHSIHSIFKANAILYLAPFYINRIPELCYFSKKSVSHTSRFFAICCQTFSRFLTTLNLHFRQRW